MWEIETWQEATVFKMNFAVYKEETKSREKCFWHEWRPFNSKFSHQRLRWRLVTKSVLCFKNVAYMLRAFYLKYNRFQKNGTYFTLVFLVTECVEISRANKPGQRSNEIIRFKTCSFQILNRIALWSAIWKKGT